MFYKLEKKDVKKVISTVIDNFKKNEKKINDLNVFPVPDGDTGTNMLLTLESIREELLKLKTYTIKSVGEAISFGGLMGARGNSGVILSQILKGFFDTLEVSEDFDLNTIEKALRSSRDLAYSSVQDPTEGTMLTTIKDLHKIVENLTNNNIDDIDFLQLLDRIIEESEKSVIRTTYLLPVLKEAGVVDAGAQGVLDMLVGLKKALAEIVGIDSDFKIKSIAGIKKVSVNSNDESENDSIKMKNVEKLNTKNNHRELKEVGIKSNIKYIYCTQTIVKGSKIDINRLREDIESLGDSAMVVGNEKVANIHVHTNVPNRVLRRALKEGTLHDIKINNMIDQTMQAKVLKEEKKDEKEEKKEERTILVVVANGDGLEEIFKSIGADIIIKGGQSMNPSTYDIVKAVNKVDAKRIIIFPNNKNIILTAKQAKRIIKKEVVIIPTRTIPQGITAVLNYNHDLELEENIHNMEKAIGNIKSGEVTVAVRNANLLVGKIRKGNFIGLCDGKVRVISDNIVSAVVDLVKDMVEGNEEVITFYTGNDAKLTDNDKIKEELNIYFPKIEIEFCIGNQPFYPYIFSIE